YYFFVLSYISSVITTFLLIRLSPSSTLFPYTTLFRSRAMFTKGQLQKGETVFIPGAGSGVATFLIQFAKNIGARVIVSSRSEAKREKALQIGADVAIDTNEDWINAMQHEKIDLIIDSVGGQTLNRDLDILKQGGRLVIFGSTTEEDVEINLRKIFANQFQLIGT